MMAHEAGASLVWHRLLRRPTDGVLAPVFARLPLPLPAPCSAPSSTRARPPAASGYRRPAPAMPRPRRFGSGRSSSCSCVADCPRTEPSATTSRPCSSKPSSRPRASPVRCTRRQAEPTSEPPRAAVATTDRPDGSSPRRTSGSDPSERTGGELSTGDIMTRCHRVTERKPTDRLLSSNGVKGH